MNTADRSIALLDVALRRRFAFVEVMPDATLLSGAFVEREGMSVNLQELLEALNAAVRRDIDRDHQIGHSYLMGVANTEETRRLEELEFVWNYRLLPLLDEYYYAQPDALARLLGGFVYDEASDYSSQEPFTVERARARDADLLLALRSLASS